MDIQISAWNVLGQAVATYDSVEELMEEKVPESIQHRVKALISGSTASTHLMKLRAHHNVTQRQVAAALATTQGAISRAESTPNDNFKLGWLQRYAKALNTKITVTIDANDITFA